MLELTKRPPIDPVVLSFAVPATLVGEVCSFLEQKGCTMEQGAPQGIPIEEVLDMRPGLILRGARYREELTQTQLADKTGIPRRHLSDMENNRRPIGKKNAQLLAEALNTGYRVFL